MNLSNLGKIHISKARPTIHTDSGDSSATGSTSGKFSGYVYFKASKAKLGKYASSLTSETLYKLLLLNDELNYITNLLNRI